MSLLHENQSFEMVYNDYIIQPKDVVIDEATGNFIIPRKPEIPPKYWGKTVSRAHIRWVTIETTIPYRATQLLD